MGLRPAVVTLPRTVVNERREVDPKIIVGYWP